MKLFTNYRSSAAFRVRIALNYKKINCEYIPVNLNKGEQRSVEYLKHNPQGRVSTLIDENVEIGQSSAILEYLEEKYPEPSLLPKNINDRAWVRYLSQIIISDMHPVMNNSSVIRYLRDYNGFDELQVEGWFHHWLKQGFDAIEQALDQSGRAGLFCLGDQLTIADVCLIPQVYNAHRYQFSMSNYPILMRIYERCIKLPCFENAKPDLQIDYSE